MGEVKVDYNILDKSIAGLKEITEAVGGDEIKKMISELDNVFSYTNSDVANSLIERKNEYNRVNNMLICLSLNSIKMFEMAKTIYKNADLSMKQQLTE